MLVPGLLCDERLFAPQRAAFDGSHDVIVADVGGADTIDGMVSAVLRQAGDDAFDLAGLSMGGIVAMALIARAPERVKRLALLDTNPEADTPAKVAMRNAHLQQAADGQLRRIVVEELLPAYLADCHRDDAALQALLLEMALALGESVFGNQTRALRDRPDQRSHLAAIRCPTLVLCGSEDRLCPPDVHRELATQISNARLEIIPACGHISTLECPQPVNAALRRWLAD